ncbi:hypothetical protein NPIL_57841 [Nephila pilipes]|uniref:Uncharacterized protein n=1 Tax=Nephila pilipes TaxID=299642 RepID=A0A8X6QTI9_NEPPI|nr:hypothetical protein NPIL_624351 [Nephila pilipes]GFU35604.1 hypothetical protein NPIL_57841 [Nephila pilipes]
MDNIVHVGSCKNSDCLILACREMKESFEHVQQCDVLDISLCGTCSFFTLEALRHSKSDSVEEQDNKIKVNPKPSSSESACQGLHAGVCTLERRLRLFCYSSNLSDSQEDGNSTDMDEKLNEDST